MKTSLEDLCFWLADIGAVAASVPDPDPDFGGALVQFQRPAGDRGWVFVLAGEDGGDCSGDDRHDRYDGPPGYVAE